MSKTARQRLIGSKEDGEKDVLAQGEAADAPKSIE